MRNSVISVEHLTKQYDLGVIGTGTISRDLNRWWARVRKQPDPYTRIGQRDAFEQIGESILALDDVSFTVNQGEALGIIGRNGAGKSTLLKILSRVTAPTSGVVKVKGRIGSLLEVGTGFHPELTGRENVYLNGAILGMKKAEVACKFDEIVSFAGVEKFIDTPVKRYSSGMYVRLAFAVAAHLDPEILIVDEVLAVGDAEFQKKCLGKMGDVATEGRTVLFVSHNMTAINSLCKRAILLDNGYISRDGSSEDVTSHYLSLSSGGIPELNWFDSSNAPGNDIARLHSIRLLSNGKLSTDIPADQEIVLEVDYWNLVKGNRLVVEVRLFEPGSGFVLEAFNTPEASNNTDHALEEPMEIGLYRSILRIPPNFLNNKRFSFHVLIVRLNPPSAEIYVPDIITFDVLDCAKLRTPGLNGKWVGTIRTPFEWSSAIIKQGVE